MIQKLCMVASHLLCSMTSAASARHGASSQAMVRMSGAIDRLAAAAGSAIIGGSCVRLW